MTTVTFDTHRAAKTLTNAGVENKQADAHVEVLKQVTNNLATKNDIKHLGETFDLKLAALESNITSSIWKIQLTMVGVTLGGVFAMLKLMPLS